MPIFKPKLTPELEARLRRRLATKAQTFGRGYILALLAEVEALRTFGRTALQLSQEIAEEKPAPVSGPPTETSPAP
jgi:hypothetical protein